MTEPIEIPEMEYIKANINDLLDLIARANKMIAFHQGFEEKDELAIRQYGDLKRQYAAQLIELFQTLDVPLEIIRQAA